MRPAARWWRRLGRAWRFGSARRRSRRRRLMERRELSRGRRLHGQGQGHRRERLRVPSLRHRHRPSHGRRKRHGRRFGSRRRLSHRHRPSHGRRQRHRRRFGSKRRLSPRHRPSHGRRQRRSLTRRRRWRRRWRLRYGRGTCKALTTARRHLLGAASASRCPRRCGGDRGRGHIGALRACLRAGQGHRRRRLDLPVGGGRSARVNCPFLVSAPSARQLDGLQQRALDDLARSGIFDRSYISERPAGAHGTLPERAAIRVAFEHTRGSCCPVVRHAPTLSHRAPAAIGSRSRVRAGDDC